MHLFIYANVAIVKCIEFVWQVLSTSIVAVSDCATRI